MGVTVVDEVGFTMRDEVGIMVSGVFDDGRSGDHETISVNLATHIFHTFYCNMYRCAPPKQRKYVLTI
jgi:hypothetical protein